MQNSCNHEKKRSSILETFSGYFELSDDPMIDAATSHSDFDLTQLRREKITIYIGFTDDDMERLRRSLKLLREYRVRCVLIMQYIAQTYEQYSHDEAKAFTNIKTKVAFATEDINDAEYISKLFGMRTVRVSAGSVSTQPQGYSESKSFNQQAIPLVRPDEITRLPHNKTLIIRTGHAPVKAQQFIWYKEKEMKTIIYREVEVPKQILQQYLFNHEISKSLLKEAYYTIQNTS